MLRYFRQKNVLRDVQTLILDGICVTSDLVSEVILDSSLNVRILSIREVKCMNERKLIQALLYAVRPSRAPNTPKLEGIYIFGRKDDPRCQQAQALDQLKFQIIRIQNTFLV